MASWLPIDLNDVSDAEILLIPGVGDRMLHERLARYVEIR